MGLLATAHFDTDDRMRAAADGPAAAAVDLAEWLVERGMPFRQAHALVGVARPRLACERGVPLAELVQANPDLGEPTPWACSSPGVAVTRRTTRRVVPGPRPVAVQLERFRHRLEVDRARVSHARRGGGGRPGAAAP